MMLELLNCEQIKRKRTGILVMAILIPLVINSLITIDLQFRYSGYLLLHQKEMGLSCWQLILKEQRVLYFPALLPFFATLILTQIFSAEKLNNGWSILLTQPVKRYKLLLSKYIIGCEFITLLVVIDVVAMMLAGFITGIEEQLDSELFFKWFLIQWTATLATAAIQLIIIVIFSSQWVSLFVSLFLGIISQNTYLNGTWCSRINPYAFSDFSFRADWKQAILMFIVSCIFIMIGLLVSVFAFNRKEIFDNEGIH